MEQAELMSQTLHLMKRTRKNNTDWVVTNKGKVERWPFFFTLPIPLNKDKNET